MDGSGKGPYTGLMKLSAWGRFPFIDAKLSHPADRAGAEAALKAAGSLIPYGLGRSYGDSPLAPNVLMSDRLSLLLGFDEANGILHAQAGVSLAEILRIFVPQGWGLMITPGTKFVSLGGAIASDVHGKNHHVAGCFSECVVDFELLLGTGAIARCSRSENPQLFQATCGGMGLTGVILAARIQLQRIQSAYIDQVTYKCSSLDEVMDRLDETASTTYSVAWIDCVTQGEHMGRSVLGVGELAPTGGLRPHGEPKLNLPIVPPFSFVRPWTIRAFNALVYHKALRKVSRGPVHYDAFFYPLDVARGWNGLYGPSGFTQYQFVLPTAAGRAGMRALMTRIAASGMDSSLAVLKTTGAQNANPLSFPLAGYTLAMDFKHQPGLFGFLDELDAAVLDHGGRVYLAKDVRVNEAHFKRMYPRWRDFEDIREKVGAIGRFASLQSKRLGLG